MSPEHDGAPAIMGSLPDVAAGHMQAPDCAGKWFATLRARAALAGIVLHQIEGDYGAPIYIATRWAMTKQLDSLGAVDAWLAMVTGKTAEAAA